MVNLLLLMYVQSFLGGSPLLTIILVFAAARFTWVANELRITRLKNKAERAELKIKIRNEKLETKLEIERGKTLDIKIENQKKEQQLDREEHEDSE